MLYKNDVKYDLTQREIDAIKKKFGKFPIRAIYPKERVKPSRLKNNRQPDKPAGISFPYRAVRKTGTGTEIWRYAEEVIHLDGGKKKYIPQNFNYTGSVVLTDKDIELVWFLLNVCPYTRPMSDNEEDKKNWNGKPPKIQFENLVKEADNNAIKKREEAEFMAMIYSPAVGLTEEKLKDVAKALFINDVDDLFINQVREQIEKAVMVDKRNGVKKFMDMVKSDVVLTVRANIQKAIDGKHIKYTPNTKEWVWLGDDGKKTELICKLGRGIRPDEAIYDLYIGDEGFKDSIHSILKIREIDQKPEVVPAES